MKLISPDAKSRSCNYYGDWRQSGKKRMKNSLFKEDVWGAVSKRRRRKVAAAALHLLWLRGTVAAAARAFTKVLSPRRVSRILYKHVCASGLHAVWAGGWPILNPRRHASAPHPRPPRTPPPLKPKLKRKSTSLFAPARITQ
jgi:hypothetical protein